VLAHNQIATQFLAACAVIINMFDGLVLQVILTALVIIGLIMAVVWFVWGFREKSAMWVVGLVVPLVVVGALVTAFVFI